MEKQFECKTCNFTALIKTNYERHLKTSKHILKCQVNGELPIVISEPKVFNELDIEAIKIQELEMPAEMKRAMAKQAESEREKMPRWGLIIMAERAEGINGRFRIESTKGQGTKIIVEVPR